MASMEVNVNVQDLDVFKDIAEKYKLYRSSYHWCAIALAVVTAICVMQACIIQKVSRTAAEAQRQAEEYAIMADEASNIAKKALARLEKQSAQLAMMAQKSQLQEQIEVEAEESLQIPVVKVLVVTATAYCPCPACCGIWSEQHPSRIGTDYVQRTSSGTIPISHRTIAVDPNVIPMGSEVWIGDQKFIAEDTGSHIQGNRIDIFFATHEEARAWGQRNVEVTVYENQAS